LAETYWVRGDQRRARAYADTARVAYGPQIRDMLNASDRAQLIVLQALALAYIGRKQEAVRRGEEALSVVRRTAAPAWYHATIQHYLARIYLLVGDPEKAIDILDLLLKIPDQVSPGWLKIDPTFAPLRGNPRFERLVSGN
jgi:tetratricopeptide (TPR) repeat protein